MIRDEYQRRTRGNCVRHLNIKVGPCDIFQIEKQKQTQVIVHVLLPTHTDAARDNLEDVEHHQDRQ